MDVSPPLTVGEINRLGDRLRTADDVNDADLAQLQELRREFDGVLQEARLSVARVFPAVSPTTRLKTVQTLVAKLKREPNMDLSRVQDVAGMRIVRDMSLGEQDDLAARIAEHFDGGKIVDRRAKPSYGYRAVHVIVKPRGRLLEIQLRTLLQDRWAQIVERLADTWGRDIRYGAPPSQPASPAGETTRNEIVDIARRMSPLIAECEEAALRRDVRVHVSADRFCGMVVVLLNELSHLKVA